MKAIVTGGTGFLGSHLVQALADQGAQVIVLARNIKNIEQTTKKNIEYRAVDITNSEKLDDAFEGVDIVFHCAALSSV